MRSCGTARLILMTRTLVGSLWPHLAESGLDPIPACVPVDEIALEADIATQPPYRSGGADIAFLQYTSGSTSLPKGVMARKYKTASDPAATSCDGLSGAQSVEERDEYSNP
jgi:acyl-CoA synthetase (AMP-forming)/AMP-acid ligase II